MAELKEEFEIALKELRKDLKERKFDQTVDLIVNLQKYDVKKNPLNLFITVPHQIKEKKIAGFLEVTNKNIDTILPSEFLKYKNKNSVKRLVNQYDFFVAQASLMPKVASVFGKVLGPSGKMPSPQLGIIANADDKTIEELKRKINHNIKFRLKEPSIKIPVGKQNMDDSKIADNAVSAYKVILNALPRNKVNVKNIQIKFTMSKPHKVND